MILIFFLSIFLVEFFSYLFELGISGSDTIYYIRAAEKWANGEYILTFHYRPLSYFLYSLALKIFGFEFYSIKIVNGIVTIISFSMLYMLLQKKIKKNHAAILSGIFLILPTTIKYAKTELMHALVVSFFMGILLISYKYFESKDKKWLILACFVLGLSLNIHRSTILFFPFFAGIIMMIVYQMVKSKKFEYMMFILSFFAFLVPIIVPMYIWGIEEVCKTFLGHYNFRSRVEVPTSSLLAWLQINIDIVKFVIGSQSILLY